MRITPLIALVAFGCAEPEPDKALTAIEPDSPLSESARSAVDAAPRWLQDDLALSLKRQKAKRQDKLAALILDQANPDLIDEIAFTIAHLSPEVLSDPLFAPSLITENAEWVYAVDPQLSYVELVEHGSVADGDWWTTTAYTASSGDFELDRDTYYWFVVHPRIEDERPYHVNAWTPCNSPTLQCAHSVEEGGMFWREFLWEGAAATCPEGNFCPVLADVAPDIGNDLWDGSAGGDAAGAIRDVVNYMKSSDDELGRWFTFGAQGERSIQPNRIYGLGRGNCGEWSDMTTAVSRTLLIPNVNVNPSSWDHTWNAFYFGGEWIAWEPVNTWVDHPYGVTYSAYATRGDASLFLQTGDYTEETFEMALVVRDADGVPVDGATVAVYSPWVQDDVTYWWPAGEQGTNLAGEASFELGADLEFAFRVDADLGVYPDEESITGGSNGVAAGSVDTIEVEMVGKSMPAGAPLSMTRSEGELQVTIGVDDTAGRILGSSARYGDSYTLAVDSPVVDVFLVDSDNYLAFYSGEPFEAVQVDPGRVSVDEDGLWYAVVSNGWAHSSAAFGTLTVTASPGEKAAFEGKSTMDLRYRLMPGEHVAIEIRP